MAGLGLVAPPSGLPAVAPASLDAVSVGVVASVVGAAAVGLAVSPLAGAAGVAVAHAVSPSRAVAMTATIRYDIDGGLHRHAVTGPSPIGRDPAAH